MQIEARSRSAGAKKDATSPPNDDLLATFFSPSLQSLRLISDALLSFTQRKNKTKFNVNFVNINSRHCAKKGPDTRSCDSTFTSAEIFLCCAALLEPSDTLHQPHKTHSRSNQSSCLGFKAQVMITRLASIMSRSLLLNGAAYKSDTLEILDIEPWRAVKAKSQLNNNHSMLDSFDVERFSVD